MKTWFPGKAKFPILFIMSKGGRRRGGEYSPPFTLTVNIRTMILNLQLFAAFCFVRAYVFLIKKFIGEPPFFSDKLELSIYVPREPQYQVHSSVRYRGIPQYQVHFSVKFYGEP